MSDIAVSITTNPVIAVELSGGATIAANIISTGPAGKDADLPIASATVLGGIKVGDNLKITDGVLSIDAATLQSYVDTTILGGAS